MEQSEYSIFYTTRQALGARGLFDIQNIAIMRAGQVCLFHNSPGFVLRLDVSWL